MRRIQIYLDSLGAAKSTAQGESILASAKENLSAEEFTKLAALCPMQLSKRMRDFEYVPTEVPCKHCGAFTRMLGTKLCDRCWELERRIYSDTELAAKILESVKKEKSCK